MRFSLRYRLVLPLVLLLLFQAIATGWAAYSAAQRVDEAIASQLQAVNRTLTEPPTFPLTARVLHQMKGLSGAEFLLVQADGQQLTTFQELPDFKFEPRGDLELTLPGGTYRGLAVGFPESHPNHGGRLAIFYPEATRQTAIREAVWPLILLGGFGAFVSILLVLTFGQSVVLRMAQLQQRTRSIAAGAFQPMLVSGSNDELRDLAESINEMASQLAEQQAKLGETERLRVLAQFSGGLAHQLRNAATGARLALQFHLTDHPDDDPEAVEVALRQLARIETNLKQFLALGKPPDLNKVPCDLCEIVRQAEEMLAAQCRHTGTQLLLKIPSKLPFVGDPVQLGHLIGNLLSNALEAAGPGGQVEVLLHDNLELQVRDNGPGPPEAIAGKLFEAFVTGREQGIGLGLAVAKQAAEAHGGTIRWHRDNGQTVFSVRLSFPNPERE